MGSAAGVFFLTDQGGIQYLEQSVCHFYVWLETLFAHYLPTTGVLAFLPGCRLAVLDSKRRSKRG